MRTKKRLTITLPPDLLAEIDRLIDKKTVRNRSHAIELLLRKSLKPTVSTAVLLAGGSRGKWNSLPALLPIQGRALIAQTIEHLIAYGICSFIILAGQNEPLIREVLGTGSSHGRRNSLRRGGKAIRHRRSPEGRRTIPYGSKLPGLPRRYSD